jgi:NitT/TauT family transport system substrate-binding protein
VILTSPQVFKEPASFVLLSARKAFADQNPRVVAAIVAGLQLANEAIAADPAAAAATYLEAEPSRSFTPELITEILRDPATEFTTKPRAVMRTAEFMLRAGELRTAPKSWSDVFVPGSAALDGD